MHWHRSGPDGQRIITVIHTDVHMTRTSQAPFTSTTRLRSESKDSLIDGTKLYMYKISSSSHRLLPSSMQSLVCLDNDTKVQLRLCHTHHSPGLSWSETMYYSSESVASEKYSNSSGTSASASPS